MDELEADYLRRQIQELRQANRRWRAVAMLSLSVLALLMVAGGATVLTGRLIVTERMRNAALQARDAEIESQNKARVP
jgi:hypothetical protein